MHVTPSPVPVHWERYNTWNAFSYDGHAARDERVASLEGVEAAERCPEFRRWVFKPAVGSLVRRTIDLYTVPFSFQLFARATDEELIRIADRLAQGLVWNHSVSASQRCRTAAAALAFRVRQRARWTAVSLHRLPAGGRLD